MMRRTEDEQDDVCDDHYMTKEERMTNETHSDHCMQVEWTCIEGCGRSYTGYDCGHCPPTTIRPCAWCSVPVCDACYHDHQTLEHEAPSTYIYPPADEMRDDRVITTGNAQVSRWDETAR